LVKPHRLHLRLNENSFLDVWYFLFYDLKWKKWSGITLFKVSYGLGILDKVFDAKMKSREVIEVFVNFFLCEVKSSFYEFLAPFSCLANHSMPIVPHVKVSLIIAKHFRTQLNFLIEHSFCLAHFILQFKTIQQTPLSMNYRLIRFGIFLH